MISVFLKAKATELRKIQQQHLGGKVSVWQNLDNDSTEILSILKELYHEFGSGHA
jgi:hypothetical protein